jgi:hypothetical protein
MASDFEFLRQAINLARDTVAETDDVMRFVLGKFSDEAIVKGESAQFAVMIGEHYAKCQAVVDVLATLLEAKRRQEFVRRVEAAKPDENVVLADVDDLLERITFDRHAEGFCWIAPYKHSYSGGYAQPLRSTWKVRTFKTLAGAKRNFLKRCLGDKA